MKNPGESLFGANSRDAAGNSGDHGERRRDEARRSRDTFFKLTEKRFAGRAGESSFSQ